MHLILASDHLSMRICDDHSDFKGVMMSFKELFDPPEQSNYENVHTSICLLPEHLTGSRCKSDPIMTGVSPPERALYNQKMILLFPAASVIRSSNKQANSLGRHWDEQHEQYRLLNTLVLHCRHDYAHRTRVWMRLPPTPPHALSPAHIASKYTVGTHTGWATESELPASAGSLASLLFCAVSWRCGCTKLVTQTLTGPLQTPTHHLGVVLRCPCVMSSSENRAYPDG